MAILILMRYSGNSEKENLSMNHRRSKSKTMSLYIMSRSEHQCQQVVLLNTKTHQKQMQPLTVNIFRSPAKPPKTQKKC